MEKSKKYHEGPATRSTVDSHAFMQEEKFDTWLDLGPLYELHKVCLGTETWMKETFSHLNCLFSGDTICMIKQVGITTTVIRNAVITPCLPAMVLHAGLTKSISSCHMTPKHYNKMYSTTCEAAITAFGYQVQHLLSNVSPELLNLIAPSTDVWPDKLNVIPKEVTNLSHIVEDMMLVLEAYKLLSEYQNGKTANQRTKSRIKKFQAMYGNDKLLIQLPSLNARITLSLDLCILHWQSNDFLLTHKYLLEVINKASEAYCGLLYAHLSSGTNLSPEHYDHVVAFLSHISRSVKNRCNFSSNPENIYQENRAFMYLKVMEGLGVATIILREDERKKWFNDDLIVQLWQSVIDEELQPRSSYFDSELCRIFSACPVSSIAEVLGLVKLCGHPSIEIYRGLSKLKERTHANIIVNPEAVNRTIGVMKRELILNFRRQRNKYPIIDINVEGIPKHLHRLIDRNISPDCDEGIKLTSNITIEHWALVILGKNEEFDPIDNQLVLLKDKALGLTRSKVLKTILTTDSSSGNAGLGPIEERRALLAFLLSDHFSESFQKYLASYIEDDVWTNLIFEYLVIKLTAKELEEKPEGRMFGASPGEERNRRIVQEENSMRLMDNFFRDQLMTPDELQMIRKLYSFRHFNKMYPHHQLLQVSFDFSKWNNNMRAASIDDPASCTLDKWFGTKIFGKTMKAFESTLFYYKDMLRSDYWDGQLGGIEGLNQATWSVIFLCGIKQALEGLGIIYQLTVKGDDVRAALVIPESELTNRGVVAVRDSILGQLSQLCQDMGWQLNPHECFVSLSVIATSKQYQVNDTFLPAAAKKMIKMESLSNLIFPTTEDMVSSIFSTAHSACSQATAVVPAFLSALYIACRLIYREMRSLKIDSTGDIAAMAMWPQCLGGPGSLPLQTFFVRGENDMLSVSISMLRSIILSGDNGISPQIKNILCQKMKDSGDKTQLVSDPYSIALDIPERPNAVLKRMMRKHMVNWVKNPDLRNLLTLDCQRRKDDFIKHISSMTPYFSKVATTLYETSPFYILEEVLSKFMESSTIFSFFARGRFGQTNSKRAHHALTNILIAAKKRKLYWAKTIKNVVMPDTEFLGVAQSTFLDMTICTTEIVHKIREASWGTPIYGITYPSLIDQNMYFTTRDLLYLHPEWNVGNCGTPITIETERAIPQTDDESLHYSAAPGLAPWLGAQTSSKLELPTMNTRISSPAINKILKLINLKVNAHILGRRFVETVDKLIQSLTGINLNQLNVLIPESGGGHISHRVAINSFSINTMPNSRPNLAQLIKIASDQGGALRGDNTNRSVNFAARHYFSIAMALWPLQSQLSLPKNYPKLLYVLFHNDLNTLPHYNICEWCCRNIDDVPITFKEHTMPDLGDFRYYTLVGCSEFEEKTLRKNLAEALMGKVRRSAQHEVQNINDPVLVNIAVQVLIRKLNNHQMKIFEAAKGASFLCTPRAELLQIMSVALGIRSLSKVSKNIIRLLPVEPLYHSVMAEIYNFCIDWLAITSDPENLYHVEKMMDHLNPLAGLFDELLDAQVLDKLQLGAKTVGGIIDFKWSTASVLSGGAAMKCFFSYHKTHLQNWIAGISVVIRPKLYTNREDNMTIKSSLEHEYIRLLDAAVNRSNVVFKGFRISSHWRRIFDTLDGDPHFLGVVDHHLMIPNFSTATYYDEIVGMTIYQLYIDDILRNFGFFTEEDIEVFWAHTIVCIELETYIIRGEWESMTEEMINSGLSIDITTMAEPTYSILDIREIDIIVRTEIYKKWSSILTASQIMYMIICCSQKCETSGDKLINYIAQLLDRADNWRTMINTRQISAMTQDNAEIIIKGMTKVAEDVIRGVNQEIPAHQAEEYQFMMHGFTQHCALSDRQGHSVIRQFTKPVRRPFTGAEVFDIPDNAVGLKYIDQPPVERYYMDATEILRGSGIHNTSVSKYMEVEKKISAHTVLERLGDDGVIICLADGLGGVTAHYLATYPQLHVVYNSLYYNIKTGKRAADANENMPPVEVSSLPAHLGALARLHWRGMYPGDLTMIEVQQLIVKVVRSTRKLPVIITMDADIPWHDDLATARDIWFGTLLIAGEIQTMQTMIILKCFCIHHLVIYEFCHLVYCLYSHVHMYRSSYTRQRSTEFFLIFCQPRQQATFLREVMDQYKRSKVFRKSLMIYAHVKENLNRIGRGYMDFRLTGLNHTLNIYNSLNDFMTMKAYPLDLDNVLKALRLSHPIRRSCLCQTPHMVFTILIDSLNSALVASDDLLLQVETRRYRDVGLYIEADRALSIGWKSIQMQLRTLAKLIVVEEWMRDMRQIYPTPFLTWTRVGVDRTYQRLYSLLLRWRGTVAPIIVQNNLIVCCERFNDNWTIMMAHTVRKCFQLLGSVYLCMIYCYKNNMYLPEALSYMSRLINIDDCCKRNANDMFVNPMSWRINTFAVSMDAPPTRLIKDLPNLPTIDYLIEEKLLIRGSRKHVHEDVNSVDPNLVDQIEAMMDQPDTDMIDIVSEYRG